MKTSLSVTSAPTSRPRESLQDDVMIVKGEYQGQWGKIERYTAKMVYVNIGSKTVRIRKTSV